MHIILPFGFYDHPKNLLLIYYGGELTHLDGFTNYNIYAKRLNSPIRKLKNFLM